ncbi:hypothetical protein GCM10027417_30600 [Glutamicibacter endophyticus]
MNDLQLKTINGVEHLVIPIGAQSVEVKPIGEMEREKLAHLEKDAERIASGKPGRHVATMRFARFRMEELALGAAAKVLRDNGVTAKQMKLVVSAATVWHLRGFEFCLQGWREHLGTQEVSAWRS